MLAFWNGAMRPMSFYVVQFFFLDFELNVALNTVSIQPRSLDEKFCFSMPGHHWR